MNAILTADISTDAVVYSAAAVAGILFVILFLRPSRKWTMKALAGVAAGAVLGLVVVWLVIDILQLVDIPINTSMKSWFVAACAAVGLAVVNFGRARAGANGLLRDPFPSSCWQRASPSTPKLA